MQSEELDGIGRGKNKFATDLVMWLVAAAMAVVLVLVEKTPVWTAILLVLLAALIFYPVMQLPGIRNTPKRQIASLPVVVCAVILFGFSVWPKENSGQANKLQTFMVTLKWLLNNAWIQRVLLIAFGMMLSTFCRRAASKLSAKRKRATTPSNIEKGFLDHKLQAEDSLQKLLPILARITKIIADVGGAMNKQAERVRASATGKTRAQVEVAADTAKMLNNYSKRLDLECVELEKVGHSITEGTYGWLRWVSKQEFGNAAAQVIAGPMQGVIENLGSSIDMIDQYLTTVESIRGVSRDMNIAVDSHLKSVRRVQVVNKEIMKSYSDCLALFETAKK